MWVLIAIAYTPIICCVVKLNGIEKVNYFM